MLNYKITGPLALITLTANKFTVVDAIDIPLLENRDWHFDGKYASSHIPNSTSKERMHRVILGALAHEIVDHINGDRLDNRRANLRFTTKSENSLNRGCRADNKSGYKGIDWHKASQKWCVRITINKVKHYLGVFTDLNEAIKVRAEFEKQHRVPYENVR